MKAKIITTLVIILVAAAIGVLAWRNRRPDDSGGKPVVKIGLSLPMTGNLGYIGRGVLGAIETAKEDLNIASLKNHYKFILEDNAWDVKFMHQINAKLTGLDKVNVIIDLGTMAGRLTTQHIAGKPIIHVNLCASDKRVADGKQSFAHTTLPEQEVPVLVDSLIGKYKNAALVVLNAEHAVITGREIEPLLRKNGIRFHTYTINPGERDMRILLEKIELKKPDVYIVLLNSPELEIFARQKKERGFKTPMTSTHYFSNTNDFDWIEGSEYVDYAQVEGDLLARILKRNAGKSDYTMCLGNAYDVITMLIPILEESSAYQDISDRLAQTKAYGGVMGVVRQDAAGVFRAGVSRRKVQNGKSVVIRE
ncbi:MAG: ABC transporter substrate-binding protein [Alphaproteobacteria bacterium]|nr:ABC transporter substrate-binding protein [Alphaproteobacteria bacterium]